MSFKGGVGFKVMMSLDPGYLNAGLMRPWRGFTPVAGKKNWGWVKSNEALTNGMGPLKMKLKFNFNMGRP
jgi:hypothetical protein